MNYISRRIAVTNEDGRTIEFSNKDFFAIDAPLVVLGEPGAGKSVLAEEFEKSSDSKMYNASFIMAFNTIDEIESTAKIIIDGIDEVTAYESGPVLAEKILRKISHHKKPNFILTCRAADWQNTINTKIIQSIWKIKPVIGNLLPLNDREIIEFVNLIGNGQKGVEFLLEAKKRDIVDLLTNPQHLKLLLEGIQESGWPDNKVTLYENACMRLLKEHNLSYTSIKKTLINHDKLRDTAGFICAQLLLAGKSGIIIDGDANFTAPRLEEFANEDYCEKTIKEVLSTMLFRTIGNNILEPCHRTIAEFLAAKWLTQELKNKLSQRRLEGILYGRNFIVPSALRGLHAWLATLYPQVTALFITRDPYGFLRYAAPEILTISQAKNLLHCLEKVAEEDPYFRAEDWYVSVGKGLLRSELRDDILRIIQSQNTPFQLSHLILESIELIVSNRFVDSIKNELLSILLDQSVTLAERKVIVKILKKCADTPNWLSILEHLRILGDINSLYIGLDIIKVAVELFQAKKIAEIFEDIVKKSIVDNQISLIGLGYETVELMSIEQLEGCLDYFLIHSNDSSSDNNKKYRYKIRAIILRFTQERINRMPEPTPQLLWSWLCIIGEDHQNRLYQSDQINDFLCRSTNYRRAVQTSALITASSLEKLWMMLCLSHTGLWLNEDDMIFHLDNIVAIQLSDGELRWKELVRWLFANQSFSGFALDHARKQSVNDIILHGHFEEIETRRKLAQKDMKKYEVRQYKKNIKGKQKTEQRHRQYDQIRGPLISGKHIGALHHIALTYLGWNGDINGDEPEQRVSELIGSELVTLALDGICAAIVENEIPSAQELINLRVNEKKISHFEAILLVYCDVLLSRGKKLNILPLNIARSALAACQWGVTTTGDIVSNLQKELESILFKDTLSKESFIYETIEPYLDSEQKYIPGLYRIKTDAVFVDVAGKVALKWLEKCKNLSDEFLQVILTMCICYATKDIISLIRERTLSNISSQWNIWVNASFLLDFEYHREILNQYASEHKDRIWQLKTFMYVDKQIFAYWPKLNEHQLYFFILKFGAAWPYTPYPSSGSWGGDENPWDASRLIQGSIKALAVIKNPEVQDLITNLINNVELNQYRDELKHARAENKRLISESYKKNFSLQDVRQVLLNNEPVGHEDLQYLIIDELEMLQRRIKDGTTNDIVTYWQDDIPFVENYCRDRIASALNSYLERYGVRIHTEGTMPDNNRCDLLHTHGLINLPIEIKGQWHSELWSAAVNQLSDYTREYHTNGYGIYLVLWFGDVKIESKKPKAWNRKRPKTFQEMKDQLNECYKGLSEQTQIFVLDLSK